MFGIRTLKRQVDQLIKEVKSIRRYATFVEQQSVTEREQLHKRIISVAEDAEKTMEDTMYAMAEWTTPPKYSEGDNLNGYIITDRDVVIDKDGRGISYLSWCYYLDDMDEPISEKELATYTIKK
jgi:hypothetical protein